MMAFLLIAFFPKHPQGGGVKQFRTRDRSVVAFAEKPGEKPDFWESEVIGIAFKVNTCRIL